jgi:hypothetical protein
MNTATTYTASDLEAVIGKLTQKDQIFAASLIVKAARYGASEKQAFWIDKLTKQARGELSQPERPKVELGSLTSVIALFAKAGEKLQRPKILLRVGEDQVVQLSIASEKSKAPGSVNVTSRGGYGNNTWYGRVSPQGQFVPSRDGQNLTGLTEALQGFAAEPAKVAAEYGRWAGVCCFCNRRLEDERSTAVGYGKTCSEHYQLPWGSKA